MRPAMPWYICASLSSRPAARAPPPSPAPAVPAPALSASRPATLGDSTSPDSARPAQRSQLQAEGAVKWQTPRASAQQCACHRTQPHVCTAAVMLLGARRAQPTRCAPAARHCIRSSPRAQHSQQQPAQPAPALPAHPFATSTGHQTGHHPYAWPEAGGAHPRARPRRRSTGACGWRCRSSSPPPARPPRPPWRCAARRPRTAAPRPRGSSR